MSDGRPAIDPSHSEPSDQRVAELATEKNPRPWYMMEDYISIFTAVIAISLLAFSAFVLRPENADDLVSKITMSKQQIARLQNSDRDAEIVNKEVESLQKSIKELEKKLAVTPVKEYLGKPGDWQTSPLQALYLKDKFQGWSILSVFLVLLVLMGAGVGFMGDSPFAFAKGFVGLFLLALIAYALSGQHTIKYYNLEYALWALLLGLFISNTIGCPNWLKAASRTEFYIKTALVLLGAEVMFSKLLALGYPGICISWIVTPVVLISTYLFGQYVLRIPSKSLNLVISADMSVCGVSAAVATGAACKAKKEELSLAIGLSLIFTVIGIVVQPYIVEWSGMGQVIGGAWIGGTIDSTGAVAAAGVMVGDVAKEVATTVKMIQNILIGVVAFCVSIYWVTFVEPVQDGGRPNVSEIWKRFPRFTIGFIGISLILSWVQAQGALGNAFVSSIVDGGTKNIREWLFCLAFISIGLESNFREYGSMLKSGKPLVLYVCGQTLNLILSFLMAYIVFTYWFPEVASSLER